MKRDESTVVIALCAGEASGDVLGAQLIEAIKSMRPDIQFVGIGGPLMKACGLLSYYDQEQLAVRGFIEVIKKLPQILKIRKGLINKLLAIKPNIFVGIDAPDFNLSVAEKLKKNKIPTVHYVSPSIWAWRGDRVNKIVHQVNKVLCLFPMEKKLYENAGGQAEFVGHPLAQKLPFEPDFKGVREKLKIELTQPVFTLMPGSRVSEIDYMAAVFLDAAKLILIKYPDAKFLLPVATVASLMRLKQILSQNRYKELQIQIFHGHAELACIASDVVIVASGTATLEVALCKRPMVISYKISPLTFAYVKRKIKLPFIGLPNILLNNKNVPELLQKDAKPDLIASEAIKWYESKDLQVSIKHKFQELHLMLKKDTNTLAAQSILDEAGIGY